MAMLRQPLRILARQLNAAPRAPLLSQPARGIAIEPGAREKALLEEDPALKQFKSNKNTVRLIKRFGDILVIIVSAGCIYQIYEVAQMRRASVTEGSSKS